MDLVKEFKSALNNPLHFKSLSIIFVTFFLVIIVGLSMICLLGNFNTVLSPQSACDNSGTKKVSSSVSKNSGAVYNFTFDGNQQCYLNAWLTWQDTKEQLTLWVYDPKGSVSIIEPSNGQTNVNFLANSPLARGDWRVIVKTDSSTSVIFNGEIAFR